MPKFEIPKIELPKLDLDLPKVEVPKPVYAGAGIAGIAVQVVKDYYETVAQKVTGYQRSATSQLTDLQGTAKSLPGKVTSYCKETTSTATGTYDDLAKRGEVFVAKLRGETPAPTDESAPAKKAPAKKTTAKRTTAKKAPVKRTTDESA